jgi:PRTRC genetic system protein C
MELEVKTIERKFKYNDEEFSDPNPEMSPNEVLDFYANTYPELTTAQAIESDYDNGTITYEFKVVKGTKG